MKLEPIITSPLMNDLYKVNMANIIYKKFNDKMTRWCFKCRNNDVEFTPEMIQEIRDQIDWYCKNVHYTNDDIAYLKSACPWLSDGYLNFLRHWRPDRSQILINEKNIQCYNNSGLAIECYGSWLDTSTYEIPILSIVNEVYFALKYGIGAKDIEFQRRTIQKFDKLIAGEYDIGTFSEFGMRRRYSSKMQDWLINYIVNQKIPGFVGTSNMYLAKKYNVKPIGTCAHEMGMTLMTDEEYNPAYVNARLMDIWTNEYGVENGIYLTDVIGRKPFLIDFNKRFATLFSGLRHDSGDPIEWGNDMIEHYKKLGIDPTTKTLLFSDALNFEKATKIKKYFEGKCKVAFGIGTYLANDLDVPALNIVMKVMYVNGKPTCKLTDNIEKAMGEKDCIDYVRRAVEWKIKYN